MNNPNLRRGSQGDWADRVADESGQILTITGIALVLMLCCVGLVVDVGHAMLVQRQLQAGVDAAALAGVQHLPDVPVAESVALQYSATPGSKNSVNTVNNAVTVAKASCLVGVPGCSRRDGGVNGITVQSTSKVPTWFGKIIGINKLTVSAKSTACSPCTVKPLDIMIVLDRTGSMCQINGGTNDPTCADLKNAKEGVKTFVQLLDPTLDKVGLALFPPVLDSSWRSNCGSPVGSGYKPWAGTPNPNVASGPARNYDGQYYGYDAWWPPWLSDGKTPPSTASTYLVASLEGADGNLADDYIIEDPITKNWDVNPASAFIQRLGCAGGAGGTSYALSVEEAQHELNANGRGSVQDIIIFLSDGAANTSPRNIPAGAPGPPSHWSQAMWRTPCAAGVQAAANAKAAGTIVYTIGYDLDAGAATPERCRQPNSNGHQNGSNPVEVGYNAFTAIQAMATDPDGAGPLPPNFYEKPDPGELNTIFRAIALDLSGARARLIDNTSPNLIS